MVRASVFVGWLLLAGLSFSVAAADIRPEVIQRAKGASALVVLPSAGGFGSAFCIDAAGYFLTNEHVVRSAGGEAITLVLQAGEDDEQVVEAEIVRQDKESDLALLRVRSKEKFAHLEFGKAEDLIETQQLIAFGYPFGTALKVKDREYPSISVNVGRITALRRSEGKLERIQLDAQLNRGNSGGPVIDTAGKVVAVVHAGVLRSGVNFAIPASRAADFLRPPSIAFEPDAVEYDRRYDEAELTADVVTFVGPRRDFDVKLLLGSDRGPRRSISAEHVGDGVYRLQAAPLIKPDRDAPLPVEIVFDEGLIRGTVDDQRLRGISAKDVSRLSDLRRAVREEDGWAITKRDGSAQRVQRFAPRGMTVVVGGVKVSLDFSQIQAFTIYEPPQEADRVPYELIAMENGEQAASVRGEWVIKDIPAPAPARTAPPEGDYRPPEEQPKFADAKVVFNLRRPYASVVSGGSGRFLVLHLKEEKKVAVFDVLEGAIVHEIPDISDDVLIAAGREKLILVLPGDMLMQRWSLDSFQRERVARLPGKGTTYRALMGANSDGPLLLNAEDATLVDVQTMEPMAVEGSIVGGGKQQQVRISADGQTAGAIPTGYGPVAFARMRWLGNRTMVEKFSSTSHATRWTWPTADGTLMTGSTGIFGPHLEKVDAQWLDGTAIYPTVDPRYFLAVRIAEGQGGKAVVHAHICTTGDRNIVHTYVGLEELAETSRESSVVPQHQIAHGQERFAYVPWANLLVTLPRKNEQIVLRRFDLLHALERDGIEYLFVDSIPPHQASLGQTLRYQIEAKSKAGDVKCKLESGPDGLIVSPGGLVTWNVPSDYFEPDAQAIVSVSNGAGKELLHSFRVKVTEGAAIRSQQDEK